MDKDLQRAVELLTPGRATRGKKPPTWLSHRASVLRMCRNWLADHGTVGFGIGYRETHGRTVEELALRVHVLRKLPRSRLGAQVIPPVLKLPGLQKPIAVDVVEGNVGQLQRAMCGDGVRLSGSLAAGTLACLVRRGTAPELLALTCRHVLDGALEREVEWLEFPPAPALPNPVIGQLAHKSRLFTGPGFPNRIDAALVRIANNSIEPAIRWLGKIASIRKTPLTIGEKVQLCGFGTSASRGGNWDGVTQGQVKQLSSRQSFDYPGAGVVGFADLVLCTPFTLDSDSGAAVVDSENRLVGIHLGRGSSNAEGLWSAFQPIGNVFALLNLTLAANVAAPPAAGITPVTATKGTRPAPPVGHRPTAIDILARTLWGEARGEPNEGRIGVANVVVNRALAPPARFGGTVEGVCRKPKQFSCWNANDPNREKLLAVTTSNRAFAECLELARLAVDGRLEENTAGSTHYHAISIKPGFTDGHSPVARWGKHDFYNDIP